MEIRSSILHFQDLKLLIRSNLTLSIRITLVRILHHAEHPCAPSIGCLREWWLLESLLRGNRLVEQWLSEKAASVAAIVPGEAGLWWFDDTMVGKLLAVWEALGELASLGRTVNDFTIFDLAVLAAISPDQAVRGDLGSAIDTVWKDVEDCDFLTWILFVI